MEENKEKRRIKGIILAGGTGSRLYPLTKVTNKHLLPVYNKPMIYYPLQLLIDSGVKDIMIVTGGENIGDFMKLLGSGQELGVRITYRCQDGSGGIPVALNLAKGFVDGGKCVVLLGDNIILGNLKNEILDFENSSKGAKIILKEVEDPNRFGVVEIDGDKIISIEEKPKHPKSNRVLIGMYMFDSKAFNIIPTLKPSVRGEVEIIDVIKPYLENNDLEFSIFQGYWQDAGIFDSLIDAGNYIRENCKR